MAGSDLGGDLFDPNFLNEEGVIVTQGGGLGVFRGVRPPARWLAVRTGLQSVTPSVSAASPGTCQPEGQCAFGPG